MLPTAHPNRRAVMAGAAATFAAPALLRAAEPLNVSWVLANTMHWVQCVAFEKGFYRDVGFEPQAQLMQNSPHSIQMAITGNYQVATSQPETFVAAVEHGAGGLAALSAPMNTPDWLLVGAPGVKSLDDLKGAVIGVSALRVSEAWLTRRLLLAHGLKAEDFSFLQVGLSPAKITGLQKGSIAAAVLFQPLAALAVREGLKPLAAYGPLRSYPTILYVVNKDWAARGDAGKRVARTLQRAHAWLWDPGNKPEAIAICVKYTKRDAEILADVYDEYFVTEPIYGRTGAIDLAGLERALADMAADGDVFKVAPPAKKYVLDPALGGLLA